MTKKLFVKVIKKIKEHREKEDAFLHALDVLSPQTNNDTFLFSDYEELVIEMLEDAMEDQGTISWWIYDTNFGENKLNKIEVDGKKITLDTPEKLYKYLEKQKKDNR